MKTKTNAPARAELVAWDGETAWKNVLGSPLSRWFAEPRSRHWPKAAQSRLERGVVLPEGHSSFQLEPDDRIFTIGSCFARNIENHLMVRGLRVESQRVDIPGFEFRPPHSSVILNKFTTHSMLNELRWALDPDSAFPESALLEEREDRWVDPQVVGEVAAAPREVVLARRPYVAEVFRRIRDCRVVVMTLGLVEAWFDSEPGIYLNRAPSFWTVKRHPGRFSLHRLDYRANREALHEIYELLVSFGHPDLRMVVTVSPVPMSETFTGGDVLVANAYSKATLRAAAEDFARAHRGVDYFPCYESVVLSDRRVAYEQDLHHVRAAIVDVNVQRFTLLYVGDAAATQAADAAERHADARLAEIEEDVLAENARLRAELGGLQTRLAVLEAERETKHFASVARLSEAGELVGGDGRPLPCSERVVGSVEIGELREAELLVSGWAVDRDAGEEPLTIVACVDGRPAGYVATAIARPDVASALKLRTAEAGFSMTLPLPAAGQIPVVRVFALSRLGAARELEYHPSLYKLRSR